MKAKSKPWSKLDEAHANHIQEPVLASSIVVPKGAVKEQVSKQVVSFVVDVGLEFLPGIGVVIKPLVKAGAVRMAERGFDAVQEGLKDHRGDIALPPRMYMVVGATTFGLYEAIESVFTFGLGRNILRLPHREVVALELGQAGLISMPLVLHTADGLGLELECSRGFKSYIEQIWLVIKPASPAAEAPGAQAAEEGEPALAGLTNQSAEQWVQVGSAHARLGNFEAALAAYERALQADPTSGLAYFGKGEALRMLDRADEALAALGRAIELNPLDAPPHRRKGYALSQLGHYQEALVVLEQAIELDPTYAHTYVAKGETLNQLGRRAEALLALDKAIELDPAYPHAYGARGDVLTGLKRFGEAQAAYRQAAVLEREVGRREGSGILSRSGTGGRYDQTYEVSAGAFAQPASESGEELIETALVTSAPAAGPKGSLKLPSGETISLVTEQAIVGRGVSATAEGPMAVNLSAEQEKATVSREHAHILRVDDHFEIEDHHSSNRTRLNDEVLVPGRRYRLRNGDVIQFGNVRCVFSTQEEETTP